MSGLRTASLRRRVVLYSLAVLGLVLVLVSVLAEVLVGIGSRAELNSRLADRAALADQLASQRVAPAELADELASPSVRVRLVGPDGVVYGSRYLKGRQARTGPLGNLAPRPAPNHEPAAPTGPVIRRNLVDGSQLTLVGNAVELNGVQRRLAQSLWVLGGLGLVVAAGALLTTTGVALRPLDTMTALAHSIAAGDRGRRLAPTQPDTELGRTAAAFDTMLDALEGAERQARQAEAAARASELHMRQFVADAAHELRTPIAGVRAAAEACLSSRATGEERDRLQLLLIRESSRAGRLVEDLLALAQIDAGLRLRREPVELLALAEAEAERTRLLAPDQTVQVTGQRVTVDADAGRLTQVLANLLDNARRYAGDVGEISVMVDGLPAGSARVRVADSGPGVPEPDRKRIFDRLVRLDEARTRVNGNSGGAGLGLAIAQGIARAHGGELRCVEGSVFELTLPGVVPAVPTLPAVPTSAVPSV